MLTWPAHPPSPFPCSCAGDDQREHKRAAHPGKHSDPPVGAEPSALWSCRRFLALLLLRSPCLFCSSAPPQVEDASGAYANEIDTRAISIAISDGVDVRFASGSRGACKKSFACLFDFSSAVEALVCPLRLRLSRCTAGSPLSGRAGELSGGTRTACGTPLPHLAMPSGRAQSASHLSVCPRLCLPRRLQPRIASKLERVQAFFDVSARVPQRVSVDANRLCAVMINLVRGLALSGS